MFFFNFFFVSSCCLQRNGHVKTFELKYVQHMCVKTTSLSNCLCDCSCLSHAVLFSKKKKNMSDLPVCKTKLLFVLWRLKLPNEFHVVVLMDRWSFVVTFMHDAVLFQSFVTSSFFFFLSFIRFSYVLSKRLVVDQLSFLRCCFNDAWKISVTKRCFLSTTLAQQHPFVHLFSSTYLLLPSSFMNLVLW